MSVREILVRLSKNWATPQPANHRGEITAFNLRCTLHEVTTAQAPSEPMPAALDELWRCSAGARLFEDVEFGQWGLVLLAAGESTTATQTFRAERGRDFLPGDRVVGQFLGDQDLLVARCDPSTEDFGSIVVSLPLDRRRDWYRAATDLEAFLADYERHQGAKFWEET